MYFAGRATVCELCTKGAEGAFFAHMSAKNRLGVSEAAHNGECTFFILIIIHQKTEKSMNFTNICVIAQEIMRIFVYLNKCLRPVRIITQFVPKGCRMGGIGGFLCKLREN